MRLHEQGEVVPIVNQLESWEVMKVNLCLMIMLMDGSCNPSLVLLTPWSGIGQSMLLNDEGNSIFPDLYFRQTNSTQCILSLLAIVGDFV